MAKLSIDDLEGAVVESFLASSALSDLSGSSSSIPDHLWHYSDSAGAAGILQSGELWATDAMFMNDPSELQLVEGTFEVLFRNEQLLADSLTPVERSSFRDAFWQSLRGLSQDPGVYAVCFSEAGDLLSQWRTYGDRGGGYALGFDATVFGNLMALGFRFFKVRYDIDDHVAGGRELIKIAANALASFRPTDMSLRAEAVLEVASDLAIAAQWFSLQIKHPAYEQEQEWRLIYRPVWDRREQLPRAFRATPRGLVPFVRVPFERLGTTSKAAVRQVKMGPTAREDLHGRAMNYLLGDLGFDLQVEQSSIPLRD